MQIKKKSIVNQYIHISHLPYSRTKLLQHHGFHDFFFIVNRHLKHSNLKAKYYCSQ